MILDLWKHRWHYKPDRQPLRNFNHLFDILENIDPEKEEPYYYRLSNTQSKDDDDNSFESSDFKNLSSLALQIDKVARIWMGYLLREAVAKAKNERVKKIIDHAVKLLDSMDTRIIQIVFADSTENIDKKPVDQEDLDRKSKVKTLNRRIGELQKFKRVNEYLISQFEKELNNLEK